MTINDEEIRKQAARIARLKIERDKGYAIKAATLMREAMALVESMDPNEDLSRVVALMADASDALAGWDPKGAS